MELAMLGTGLLVGAWLCLVVVRALAPRLMLEVHRSLLPYQDTVRAVEKAVRDSGWVLTDSKNFTESLEKQGALLPRKVHLIKLCKPDYALEVLQQEPRVACLMPCTLAIFEDPDGLVHISKMNTRIMGKLFGGVVARVMGGPVAREERAMLDGIVRGRR